MKIYSPTITGSVANTNIITTNQTGSLSVLSSSFAASATTASYVVSSVTDEIQNTRLTTIEAVTGSFATTGSNQFNGSQTVTGSLTATGTIVAQTLVVQTITSSVDFVSGSTKFGSTTGNTHQFTGSVLMSGSQTVNGALTGTNATFSSNVQLTGDGYVYGNATAGSGTIRAGIRFNSTSQELKFFTADLGRLTIDNTGSATFTGALSGTSATFTGDLTSNGELRVSNANGLTFLQLVNSSSGGRNFTLISSGASNPHGIAAGNFYLRNSSTSTTPLLIDGGTGAATFSSTVTATGFEVGNGQFYRARRTSSNLLTDMIGIPSGTNDVRILTTGAFNVVSGALTTMLTVTDSGNVGIGTTSPGALLDIARSSAGGSIGMFIENTASSTLNNSADIYFGTWGGSTIGGITNARISAVNVDAGSAATDLRFHTYNGSSSAERMRILSGGVIYINTATNPLPDNAAPQLGIIAATSTDAVNIKHLQNGNNSLNIWQTGTTQHNAIAFYKGDAQSNRGNIVVTTSGTSYNTVSDYRLKENVTLIQNGLDRLMQLKPSKFNWIETGEEAEGFIAHELQEIFPDAVTGEKDAIYSSTGNIKPQSVDYGRITPLLVKALQELKAELNAANQKIAALETA